MKSDYFQLMAFRSVVVIFFGCISGTVARVFYFRLELILTKSGKSVFFLSLLIKTH